MWYRLIDIRPRPGSVSMCLVSRGVNTRSPMSFAVFGESSVEPRWFSVVKLSSWLMVVNPGGVTQGLTRPKR